MTRATESSGRLAIIENCKIKTPKGDICLRVLPEITDSKAANYANEPVIGRTTPVVTYGYSEPRSINTELTFIITKCEDIADNLRYYRIIQSLVYPGPGTANSPYTPPPVSKFVCGRLFTTEDDCPNENTFNLKGEDGVCVILKNYSARFPTDVAWDSNVSTSGPEEGDTIPSYLPYRFTISCSWEVVYSCDELPTCTQIARQTRDWCPIPKEGLEIM